MKAKKTTKIEDELNPDFIFSITSRDLLVKAAHGEIDLNHLAKRELANRGLNLNGTWVGFKTAAANIHLFWDRTIKNFISVPPRD